jgi:hypothetical protein
MGVAAGSMMMVLVEVAVGGVVGCCLGRVDLDGGQCGGEFDLCNRLDLAEHRPNLHVTERLNSPRAA